MTEISPKAHTFVTKNSGDQTIIPSSMQQGMLPQLSEVSSHVALDKNSENIERGEQSLVQMGGIDEVVMDPMNIATLTETEGCFSHLPVNEGTEIMVVIKEQSEAKVVLDQFVQNNNSHVTEALKGEEEDRALRPLSSRKPRRKLLPASAMLLKDLGELNMDENSKETNGKTISNANDGKSQGSISLVRILHGSLPR
ncbi:hypothetical protein AXF42_Ash009808 [Apostasia shenzhenica]|uniref:Uncharacterized protein n=1 Tax=Apostasia shenzhenica TaxID=1088818 RepID=A0A2I0AX55_9ASPA|nr:hypothetical protein AXF42_Ash009808 [Apostasia shenzhenica]